MYPFGVVSHISACEGGAMPERSRKRPRDLNQLATSIVEAATEGEPELPDDGKNPAAVALGRLGGKKGGKARAEILAKPAS